MNNEFTQYQHFVEKVTSETGKDTEMFIDRIRELESGEVHLRFAEMDNAIAGIAGEAGEINDLWKKVCFHSKPWNEENREKMISEASDMLWYYAKFLQALDISIEDVVEFNIDKLTTRYPGGEFSVKRSEERSPEDS